MFNKKEIVVVFTNTSDEIRFALVTALDIYKHGIEVCRSCGNNVYEYKFKISSSDMNAVMHICKSFNKFGVTIK